MRSWWVLFAAVGCGFDLQPSTSSDAPSPDAPDAMPDAPLPACMTSAAYTAGGPQLDHRYRVISTTSSYDTAVEQCAADGAHLAAIESALENTFVTTLLDGSDAWIGYDDLDREGTFRWVSGAPEGFRAFIVGEPNDSPTEDCTVYLATTQWNDSSCGQLHRGVCECDPAYVAPPVAACRALPADQSFHGRGYHVRTTKLSWPDAVAECAAIGAYLAVPADNDENTFIDTRFALDSWIGGSDLAVEGTLAWVNGAPAGYTRWATTPVQPTNQPGENCVAIAYTTPSGAWDDSVCTIPRQYACECDPLVR